jgi:hypothetical protein
VFPIAQAAQGPAVAYWPEAVTYKVNQADGTVFPWRTVAEAMDPTTGDPGLLSLTGVAGRATDYATAYVLVGDSLVWYGDAGVLQTSQNTNPAGYTYGAAGMWSPSNWGVQSVLSGAEPTVSVLDQGANCATDEPQLIQFPGTSVWWHRWCMGPLVFAAELDSIQYPNAPVIPGLLAGDEGYFGVGARLIDGSQVYSGPENATQPASAVTTMTYHVVNPSLTVVKQVCSTGTGCDPADDPADVGMATQVDTEGVWVDAQRLPEWTRQVEWRLTAFNTGSIPLQNVTVASDAYDAPAPVAAQPATCDALGAFASVDSGHPVMSANSTAPGGEYPTLNVGDAASQTCTTGLTGDLDGVLVNTAQLTSTFTDQKYIDTTGKPLVDRFPSGVPSNVDDATVTADIPAIKLTKWVCATGTGCMPPTEADLTTLAGIGDRNADGTWAVTEGAAAAGWVKATSVAYGSDAQWLMVVTNTGNTDLASVGLTDEGPSGTVTGATDAYAPAGVATLASGESAAFTMATHGIADYDSWGTGLTGDPDPVSGERAYAAGHDVVNTAKASGTPAKGTTPLTDASGKDLASITSNESVAEVNTAAYAVGDYVWIDTNKDGQQGDPTAEPPVAGVTVALLDADGNPVKNADGTAKTMVTDANGYYYFDALPAGKYMVQFALPQYYTWTTANTTATGSADPALTDSDALTPVTDSGDRRSAVFTLGDQGTSLPHMIKVADAPADYRSKITAAYIDPTIDAGLIAPNPALSLVKYACQTGLGCTPSAATDAQSLAAAGWVKETTVLYNTDVQWLIVIANTGDVPLTDVTLTDDVTGTGHGATSDECKSGTVVAATLAAGKSVTVTCTTKMITNTNPLAADDATSTAVVNTAQAQGTPPPTPDTKTPRPIPSQPDSGEVNTIAYAVGDYVWIDANRNGQQDAAEQPRPGVTVELFKAGGTASLGTTVTDNTGYYVFDKLAAGDYYVQFTLPDGYAWTTKGATTVPVGANSDADQVTGRSDTFTLGVPSADLPNMVATDEAAGLTANYIDPTIDAGVYVPTAGIKTVKYVCGTAACADPAGTGLANLAGFVNGQVTAGTPGVNGWVKETQVAYGAAASWLIAVTNTGQLTLTDVTLADEYLKSAGAVPLACSDTTDPRTLAPGESTLYHCLTASVTNPNPFDTTVGADVDQYGEPTYATGDDIVNAATATGQPVDAAGQPARDTDGQEIGPLTSNQSSAEVDAQSFAVGDYVWIDSNRDGKQGTPTDEPPLGKVKVALFNSDTTPVLEADGKTPKTTTTDDSGYYCFDKLASGDYYVQFTLPSGYAWTTKGAAGVAVTANSDADQATGKSAVFTLGVPGSALPNMVATDKAGLPAYAAGLTAKYVDPTIDAGVYVPASGLKLVKWVCSTYDSSDSATCANPTGTALSAMAGYVDGQVTAGQPWGGWVKETQVAYGTSAAWLVVVTNTGELGLTDVTVEDTYINSVGATTLACNPNDQGQSLQPGESALYHCTTASVTNSADFSSEVVGDGTGNAFGEPTYEFGDDVVNGAVATAQPAQVNAAGHLQVDQSTGKPIAAIGTNGATLPRLTSNQSSAEVNALSFAVGDYAWIDANGNGQQDAGETPVPGMTVALVGADGQTVATMPTDENGYYLFDLVPPGTYQVVFTLPNGYLWTAANQGAVQTDSDARGESASAATVSSAPFTLAVGKANVVAATDASVPTEYTVKAPYVNPTLDAGILPVAPQIDIEKWVCKAGTGCTEPSGDALASLSLTAPPTGWVKATTVDYDTAADWMILVQNTGNVTLAHVDLVVENFDAGGARFTNENCGTTTADATLQPGQFMAVYCTITHVTNVAALGSGEDIVNTAQASGTPVKPDGTPILTPKGETWEKVVTRPVTAEANAKPPYQVKGGGYTTAAGGSTVGSFLAFGLILLGIGVYTRRRRRA